MNRLDFFRQLNTFFDHVYVITLKRATDRHEHIKKELKGLNYELFFGRDKNEFTVEGLSAQHLYDAALAKKHHRYHKAMQPGQVGCAWSHLEVYRDIVNHNYQRALILEDDVIIDESNCHVFNEAVAALPADWQLLYLGFAEKEKTPALAWLKKSFYHLLSATGQLNYTHRTINNLYPKKITKHLYIAGYHDCTHAYGLTQTAAIKLIELQQPISFVADNLLAYAATNNLLKSCIILPKIINQQYQVGQTTTSYLNT